MSVRKLTASLLTALVLLGGVASVGAQEYVPVADPFAFDPDFQWFEPVYDMDLADMKPSKRAHDGWFATYDRLNLYFSRPETDEPDISETKLDGDWGHRYEIGFMLPGDDNGWMFNWTKASVGEMFTVRKTALNQFFDGDGGLVTQPFGFIVPPGIDNNIGHDYRFYDVQDTENVLSYDSYELNKTWRMEPYHYGGILEPMVGLRWMRIHDINGFQRLVQSTDPGIPLFGPNAPTGGAGEQLTSVGAFTDNEMFGGQLGFRYFKFRDRFTFSSDFRAFFGGNWQCSKSQQSVYTAIYDLTGTTVTVGDEPELQTIEVSRPIYSRNEEFYVGFDVRTELAYQLTRLISVRAGVQLIDIGKGLWRGGDGTLVAGGDTDQDLLMVGGTFGVNINH